MHAPHCGTHTPVMRNRAIDATLIPRIHPPNHITTGRANPTIQSIDRRLRTHHTLRKQQSRQQQWGPPAASRSGGAAAEPREPARALAPAQSVVGRTMEAPPVGLRRSIGPFPRRPAPSVSSLGIRWVCICGMWCARVSVCVYKCQWDRSIGIDRRVEQPIIIRSIKPIRFHHTSTHTHIRRAATSRATAPTPPRSGGSFTPPTRSCGTRVCGLCCSF
jgi:hypothetical protein